MRAYTYNERGDFVGTVEAQESPLEKGVYLLPPHATLVAPEIRTGKRARWTGSAWEQVDAERPQEPSAQDRRAARYKAEADPLLLAAIGYQIEKEAGGSVDEKLAKAKADYLAAKAKIRQEIP